MKRFRLLPVLLCLSVSPWAQTPATAPSASASTHPDDFAAEPLVIVRMDSLYDMRADGTGIRKRIGVARVQSEAMLKQFSVLSIPFAGSSQTVVFEYVRARHSDGTVTETPPSDMLQQPAPVTREAPFYSDLKVAEIPIRGLRVGDTVEWQSTITDTRAEVPGQFWGQDSFITDGVTLEQSDELRAPAAVHVNAWTNPASGVKFTETTTGDTHIYRWTHSNLKPTVGAAAEAQKEADKKKILTAAEELDAEQGKLPDIAWTTFPDWQSVGAWYHGLEADRMQPSPAVQAKVAELTAGKTTQEERVRAVYAYVATQIHYIGVAFGIGRYQPHTADEILANQYGDCKDKHTLLASMLSVLGLQPDAVLIGSEIRFNQAVPSPQSFNHLITRVQLEGKPVWLDSTTEVAPYRMLLNTLRDKQALVIPAGGPAHIDRTPTDPPFPAFEDMTAKGSLDKDGISNSRITLTYRGDTELFLREVARQITPAQYDDFSQKLVGMMGYAGTTSHTEVGRPDDTSQPFTISFDYHREKAGDWDNHRIIAQLAPVGLPVLDPKDPPHGELDLRAPRVDESHAEMRVPEGWNAELPEAVHASSPYATYDLTFHFDKGLLVADRRVTVLRQHVPVSDWKQYKTWQDAIDLGDESYIQLTPPVSKSDKSDTAAASTAASTAATSPSPTPAVKGADLLDIANQSLQVHQLDNAQVLLDRARAANGNLRGLWNSYGFLAFSRGNTGEAIADYRKELDLHPGDAWAYEHLATLQIATGQHADAAQTLHTWMAADPNDARPVLAMMGMLLDDGKPAEAVAAGKSGLAHLDPENTRLQEVQVALGSAQIKAGDLKDADATLTPLLSSSKALILNNAAYALADANLELPATEAAERAALKKLDDETTSWTLHESSVVVVQASQLLTASWDTMGWILFREGKAAEAMPYLNAARQAARSWDNSQHLGDVALARGDRAAALAFYQEAENSIPKVDAMGIHKDPGPGAREIQRKIDHLKEAGVKPSALTDPMSQQARTFKLGPANGRSVAAEYRLLLSRNKVEAVEPVDAKNIPDASTVLANLKTTQMFPPGSGARLVRDGFLNCHGSVCELVLRP